MRSETKKVAALGASVAMIAAGLVSFAAPAAATEEARVFASPDGGGEECTQAAPCDLLAARDRVRDLAPTMSADISVVLGGGTYRLDEPLRLTDADSGRNGHTVRWAAAPDAEPVISTAEAVDGWTPADDESGVWVADVGVGTVTRQLVVDDVLAVRAREELDRAAVTFTATGMSIDPSLSHLASLPDQDGIELHSLQTWTDRYTPVDSISGTEIALTQPAWTYNTVGWDTVQSPFRTGAPLWLENAKAFLDEPGEWFNDTAAGLLYYKPLDGQAMDDVRVELPRSEAVVSVSGTLDAPVHHLSFTGITFTGNSWLHPSGDEGYADQQTGAYLSGDFELPSDSFTACAMGCEPFEATRPHWKQMPAAVQISAAHDITIADSTFRGIGSDALGIGQDANAVLSGVGLGASDIVVRDSTFTEIAGGGITIGGIQQDAHHPSDPRMINKDFTITRNTISRIGVDYRGTDGILGTYTENAQITRNELSSIPYTGISVGFGWGVNDPGGSEEYRLRGIYNHQPVFDTPTTAKNNIISENSVIDFMQEMSDGGCFYTLSASPGTRIDRNYCKNGGEQGLYWDEGSRYMSARNNVFEDTHRFTHTNARPTNRTGEQTLIDNWTTTTFTTLASTDIASGTAYVTDGDWRCGARQIIANAGITPDAPTVDSYDALDPSYAETSLTESEIGQCADTFGITTEGAEGNSRADRDLAYAAAVAKAGFGPSSVASIKVDSLAGGADAGILVRDDAADRRSSGLFAVSASEGGVTARWDADGNGIAEGRAAVEIDAADEVWVRISRTGAVYQAEYSTDAVTFRPVGDPVALKKASDAQDVAPFAAQSPGTAGTSQLSALDVADAGVSIFSTGRASVVTSPRGTVITGAGGDVWRSGGQSDDYYSAAFRADGLEQAGSATVEVRSQQNTSTWAKAGLMVRNDISANRAATGYAVLAVTPGYGIVLASDTDGDGLIDREQRAASAGAAPTTLRMVRDGATIVGQYSGDGTTWTDVGTVSLVNPDERLDVGTFALSHDAEAGTSSFGPLTVANDSDADTVRPVATLVSPTTAGPHAEVEIAVDATDDRGLALIVANIYENGKLVRSTQTTVDGGAAASHRATVKLPSGDYTVKYNAHDVAGNVSKTGAFAFAVDDVAPTATPKNGAKYTVGSDGVYDLVSFKLHDVGRIDRIELNGIEKDLSDNAWSDVNFIKPGTFGAVVGKNTLVVFDVAGNRTELEFTLN